MKLSDYVFDFLSKNGVSTVFFMPGGGCMHLLDSLGSTNINAISLLHEQAVAVACESYANTSGRPGVALVTTGPGGTNTVTGVLAAYLDSVPCLFVSGQVKTTDLKRCFGVRCHGSQEADIVSIVSTITKYSVMVTEPFTIRYHLERAWHEMNSGRRGPVWIDIPLDVQAAQIEPGALDGFSPENPGSSTVDVAGMIRALNKSKRPVIIAGNGLAYCKDKFFELIDFLQVPIIPTWKAIDYIPNDHPLYAGRSGGMGDRHGNFAVQNSDLILSLGSRLDFSITGYDRSEWAINAEKIIVDIDANEISKLKNASNIVPLIADVSDVISALLMKKDEINLSDISPWKNKISGWKVKYPLIASGNKLTSYHFINELCKQLPEGAHITSCNAGTTVEIFSQAFIVKPGQVIRASHGLGAMGFEIPNAIGMCVASGMKEVVCVAGDGGIQLNIQELSVIRGRNLPIKIFAVNNNGYASIRNMQNNHFNGRHIGCDKESGLFLPELSGLAEAYDIPYFHVGVLDTLCETVKEVLKTKGPVLCEIVVDAECFVSPRTATQVMPDGSMRSSPLENQFPFLTEDEVKGNMLVRGLR